MSASAVNVTFSPSGHDAATDDSPLFQLIPKFPGIDLPEEVTDAFKDRIKVNAINLLIQKGDASALKEAERLLPLVSFAVARRGGASSSDYWDIATALELACIGGDWALATQVLPRAVLAATDSFKTQTTLGNLQLLKEARERAGQSIPELDAVLTELSARTSELRGEEQANAN